MGGTRGFARRLSVILSDYPESLGGDGRLLTMAESMNGIDWRYDPLPFAEALVTGVDPASRAVMTRIDDAFNIATHLSQVVGVEGQQLRVRQNFPLGYVGWRVGDTLAGYAMNTGNLLERARVLAVEEQPDANPDHAPQVTLMLDRAVPRLAVGGQVWAVEAANPDTTLRRCTIHNSCRFQSRVTLEDCDVTALLWFYGETIEGPLPSGSVVRRCRLRLGRGNPDIAVACSGRLNGLPTPVATNGMPPLMDLRFEENEIDGRFDLRHAQKVQLVNNRFAPDRGQLTIGDCREVVLQGNRLGEEMMPAARIQIEDQATRDSVQQQ